MRDRQRKSRLIRSAPREKKVAARVLKKEKTRNGLAVMHGPALLTSDYKSYEQALRNHLLPMIDRMDPGCDAREIWLRAFSMRDLQMSSNNVIVDTVSVVAAEGVSCRVCGHWRC